MCKKNAKYTYKIEKFSYINTQNSYLYIHILTHIFKNNYKQESFKVAPKDDFK